MGKMSRDKGARFERQIAAFFRDWGYDTYRTAQVCGYTGQAADVEGLPFIHIEAKHCEKMHLYDWYAQAERDARAAKRNEMPVVIHKANNKPILVTMSLPHFAEIYREYEAGQIPFKEVNDGSTEE